MATIKKPRNVIPKPRPKKRVIDLSQVLPLKPLLQEEEKEQIKQRIKYWSLGPFISVIRSATGGTILAPYKEPFLSYKNSEYNLVITEWWVKGQGTAPTTYPQANNFGRRWTKQGTILVPDLADLLVNFLFVNSREAYIAPNALDWVQILNKPIVLKAGDQLQQESFNQIAPATDVVYTQLLVGRHESII